MNERKERTSCPSNRKFSHLIGACFGLLSICRPKVGRPTAGRGGSTVITGTLGIYFLPPKMP